MKRLAFCDWAWDEAESKVVAKLLSDEEIDEATSLYLSSPGNLDMQAASLQYVSLVANAWCQTCRAMQ